MLGTGHEMLYYFTHDHNARVKLGLSVPEAYRLRDKCRRNMMSEETLERYLTILHCRKIRDHFVLPAILRTNKGKLYTEKTILTHIKDERYTDFNLKDVRRRISASDALPDKKLINCICRREFLKVVTPRMELPSVWEYDPTGTSGVREVLVEKIIGFYYK